jgi:Fe-S cluster biosynthesis and repair protein YggX
MSREKLMLELSGYLEKEPNMVRSDRREYLKNIVDRFYFEQTRTHVINRIDLLQIVSNGADYISKKRMPIHISEKRIESSDVRHVAMIEAVIGYMARNGLLSKEVRFDYTSDEYAFEPIED